MRSEDAFVEGGPRRYRLANVCNEQLHTFHGSFGKNARENL